MFKDYKFSYGQRSQYMVYIIHLQDILIRSNGPARYIQMASNVWSLNSIQMCCAYRPHQIMKNPWPHVIFKDNLNGQTFFV